MDKVRKRKRTFEQNDIPFPQGIGIESISARVLRRRCVRVCVRGRGYSNIIVEMGILIN